MSGAAYRLWRIWNLFLVSRSGGGGGDARGADWCGGDLLGWWWLGGTDIVMAVIELLGFILPIPICMFRIVQTNKPRVSLYDAEGKLRQGDKAYTDDDYRRDLEKDISPYKTLYVCCCCGSVLLHRR